MSQPRLILAAVAAEGLSREPARRAEQIAIVMGALTEAFRADNLRIVLVGGSAIEVWAPGAHVSDDTDVVVTGAPLGLPLPERAAAVLHELALTRQGLGWSLGSLYIHVVGYAMDEPTATVELGPVRFEVVQPEVPLADRMIGFKHWPNTTAYGQQAIAMLEALGDTLDEAWLRARLHQEDALDVLEALRALLQSEIPLTDQVLADLQRRLGGDLGRDAKRSESAP